MANKRVRNGNTLTTNGSIHPKKIQKVMEMQQLVEQFSPEAEEPELITKRPSTTARKSRRQENRRNPTGAGRALLPPKATKLCFEWFITHLRYAYPSREEKADLAQKGEVAVKQVSCWMANTRNRHKKVKDFRRLVRRCLALGVGNYDQDMVLRELKRLREDLASPENDPQSQQAREEHRQSGDNAQDGNEQKQQDAAEQVDSHQVEDDEQLQNKADEHLADSEQVLADKQPKEAEKSVDHLQPSADVFANSK